MNMRSRKGQAVKMRHVRLACEDGVVRSMVGYTLGAQIEVGLAVDVEPIWLAVEWKVVWWVEMFGMGIERGRVV
ncbi:hypothetical protein Tco_1109573 [Tanacetum coccineum]